MIEIKHKFFDVLKDATRRHGFDAYGVNQAAFFRALKKAHPFVFDKKCTETAMSQSSGYALLSSTNSKFKRVRDVKVEASKMVEDFSLPFSTSLYILTGGPTIVVAPKEGGEPSRIRAHGYLIEEKTPETFTVYVVTEMIPMQSFRKRLGTGDEDYLPVIDKFEIDLSKIAEVQSTEEALLLSRLTSMISVKRIGIERKGGRTFKTGGSGLGFTTVKFDNLYHVADKVEYEYATPLLNGEIDYQFMGFWRGHWRAFYVKDAQGENVTDPRGWNRVDYGKVGKNRKDEYCVPGYTWVVEHTKGDPKLAEIKKRVVVNRNSGSVA